MTNPTNPKNKSNAVKISVILAGAIGVILILFIFVGSYTLKKSYPMVEHLAKADLSRLYQEGKIPEVDSLGQIQFENVDQTLGTWDVYFSTPDQKKLHMMYFCKYRIWITPFCFRESQFYLRDFEIL